MGQTRACPISGKASRSNASCPISAGSASAAALAHDAPRQPLMREQWQAGLNHELSKSLKSPAFSGTVSGWPKLPNQGINGCGEMSPKELREHSGACRRLALAASGEGKACLIAVARLWEKAAEDIERKNWEAEQRVRGTAASPDQYSA